MFSKLATKSQLTALTTMGFRTSQVAAASKKPSIGDAVTILQSKVSQINQVVSSTVQYRSQDLGFNWREPIKFNLIKWTKI
jgi:hypothetical protein